MGAQTVGPALRRIAQRFEEAFPERLDRRTFRRRAEHPVVNAQGHAVDARELLPLLGEGLTPVREGERLVGLKGPHFAWSTPVGRGSIALITRPCEDLHELGGVRDQAMARLVEVCQPRGWRVLGYGAQPLTPPSPAQMSPQARYEALLQALGEPWLGFTVTASDRSQVRVTRSELWTATQVGNLLAGVTVALCANSPVHSGGPSGFLSGREGLLDQVERYGMPSAPTPHAEAWVEGLAALPFLLPIEGPPSGEPFRAWLTATASDGERFAAFLQHARTVWPAARPEPGALEMGAACQQPGVEHDAAATLALGMVLAAPELQAWLDRELGDEAWPTLRAWYRDVQTQGLRAPEPFPKLIRGVLDHCAEALIRRGRSEERKLEGLYRRLGRRKSPADHILTAFEADGVAGIVAAATIG